LERLTYRRKNAGEKYIVWRVCGITLGGLSGGRLKKIKSEGGGFFLTYKGHDPDKRSFMLSRDWGEISGILDQDFLSTGREEVGPCIGRPSIRIKEEEEQNKSTREHSGREKSPQRTLEEWDKSDK